MKNIILCGFMGCGKSTVGKRLAQALDYTFVDTDSAVEAHAGKSVSRIFKEDGEAAFRRMESDMCRTLGAQTGLVIATGGGAVLNSDNVNVLKSNGILVWLKVSAQTVVERLAADTTRPLLQCEDKEAAVQRLLVERNDLYHAAVDVVIDADSAAEDVVADILNFIKHPY